MGNGLSICVDTPVVRKRSRKPHRKTVPGQVNCMLCQREYTPRNSHESMRDGEAEGSSRLCRECLEQYLSNRLTMLKRVPCSTCGEECIARASYLSGLVLCGPCKVTRDRENNRECITCGTLFFPGLIEGKRYKLRDTKMCRECRDMYALKLIHLVKPANCNMCGKLFMSKSAGKTGQCSAECKSEASARHYRLRRLSPIRIEYRKKWDAENRDKAREYATRHEAKMCEIEGAVLGTLLNERVRNMGTIVGTDGGGEFELLPTDVLRAELLRCLGMTAENILRISKIILVLEQRGEDLSELRISLMDYYRRVGTGQLAPEVIVRFCMMPELLKRIAQLPISEQRRLSAGESLRLVCGVRGGEVDFRMADPVGMTRQQIAQVFKPSGGLRSDAEQLLVLEDRQSPQVTQELPQGQLRGDRGKGTLVMNRTEIPVARVVETLAAMHKPEGEGVEEAPKTEAITVKFSEDEKRRLAKAAADIGQTVQYVIRQALLSRGLL